jgi:hypothetical protein
MKKKGPDTTAKIQGDQQIRRPGETTTTRRGERQKEESQLVSSFLSI